VLGYKHQSHQVGILHFHSLSLLSVFLSIYISIMSAYLYIDLSFKSVCLSVCVSISLSVPSSWFSNIGFAWGVHYVLGDGWRKGNLNFWGFKNVNLLNLIFHSFLDYLFNSFGLFTFYIKSHFLFQSFF
jgi:hypothetical protein